VLVLDNLSAHKVAGIRELIAVTRQNTICLEINQMAGY
jgi:hypothetical protein